MIGSSGERYTITRMMKTAVTATTSSSQSTPANPLPRSALSPAAPVT